MGPFLTRPRRTRREKALLGIVTTTAAAAAAGGALLIAAPDGSLLRADPGVLAGSPFGSWRVPGLLLLVLVGGGFALSAALLWRRAPLARAVSTLAGAGLVCFEAAEWAWLGLQPLELVFMAVGCAVVAIALG